MNKIQRISLAEADLTVKSLAQRINRSPIYVSQILSGCYVQHEMRKKIAQVLGKPVHVLWPQENREEST